MRVIPIVLLLLVVACGAPPPPANATGDAHREGRALFLAKCGGCHDHPDPHAFGDDEWRAIVDRMVKRAGLDAKQKETVLAYVLAMRHAK